MKVAFATEDLHTVDAHFGWAKNIIIYQVDNQGYDVYDTISFNGNLQEDGNEDKLLPKVEAVRDCALLYVSAIGGSAAARIVACNVFPIKVQNPEVITSILDKLVNVLNGTPPPWLRKALNRDKEKNLNFED